MGLTGVTAPIILTVFKMILVAWDSELLGYLELIKILLHADWQMNVMVRHLARTIQSMVKFGKILLVSSNNDFVTIAYTVQVEPYLHSRMGKVSLYQGD